MALATGITAVNIPRSSASGRRYVPALPTLWPSMLAPGAALSDAFPFNASQGAFYYLARNGVYHGARLLGLAGREVLVPAYHHGVEVGALLAAGAVPVFVRVDSGMRLDLDDAETHVGGSTKALHVIHYAGFAQPMNDVRGFAKRHGLYLIEDCALSLFACDGDRPVGSTGDLGVFCLYKTLPVPNGGMLVVNGTAPFAEMASPDGAPVFSTLSHVAGSLLSNLALRMGQTGQSLRRVARAGYRLARCASGLRPVSTGTMEFELGTVDLGMSPISSIIANHADREAIVSARRRNFSFLLERLRERVSPIVDELPRGASPLFYPLRCSDKDEMAARLKARGIETIDFWRTGHPLCRTEDFPEVAQLRRQVLEVPCHQDLEPEDLEYIARSVGEALP